MIMFQQPTLSSLWCKTVRFLWSVAPYFLLLHRARVGHLQALLPWLSDQLIKGMYIKVIKYQSILKGINFFSKFFVSSSWCIGSSNGPRARLRSAVNTTRPFYKSEQPNILTWTNGRGGGGGGLKGWLHRPRVRHSVRVHHLLCVRHRQYLCTIQIWPWECTSS